MTFVPVPESAVQTMESRSPPPRTGREAAEAFLSDPVLVERLRGLAFSRFAIGREDAEDLVQETAVAVAGSSLPIARPEGYVFQVFDNRCRRFVNRRARDLALNAQFAHEPTPSAMDRESALALWQGFARISPRCRALLTSRYVDGASLRETALLTGHSPKQVWKRLTGCLKKLRECLEA